RTFKSKYITAELAHLFTQSDSEEEFEGFSEDEAEEDRGCFKDLGVSPCPRLRRNKSSGNQKKQNKNCSVFLQKRKRISQKVSPQKRKFKSDVGSERRNPSRKARPPENFGVEEKPEPARIRKPRTLDIWRLMEVDEERIDGRKKKKRSPKSRKSQFMVKSVDEITDEDLENVAYRSKDKIWDKDNGSSCHQCRQKTLDTKTVCRSGYCVGVKGQFCGPCLKNRYGEDVRTVLLDPTWSCPICRGMCNCSLCRKKEGRCATGTLVALARYNGHDNVHEYLESIQKELQ
uniref:Cell division cycle associated 7 like n=1 Tax=Xiphophorus couchianus TaxID=32473 RepID=A0A3B5MTE1_9TELE